MFNNKLKFLLFSPLLMAFQCEDDLTSKFVFNSYKAKITSNSSFSLNDTIWIDGKISSKIFDLSVNDSIFESTPQDDIFSIYKFIEPTESYNCIDAVDKFELISDKDNIWFLPDCQNANIAVLPELESNTNFYSYRIGIKPNSVGDYVISWKDVEIQNSNRNEFIVENYPIESFPNEIGFNSCGSISWRSLNESYKEYYFKVE